MLNELRNAIEARLRAQQGVLASAGAKQLPKIAAESAGKSSPPHLATILLADATEDLEAQRNAVK